MSEWRLFEGETPHVSTYAYHEHRDRAPHLEQPPHRERLELATRYVLESFSSGCYTLSDLGCGDGGLLSLIKDIPDVVSWGYDFTPANAEGWAERGVTAYLRDVFGAGGPVDDGLETAVLGDVVVVTEVLEHLADPHGVLRTLRRHARRLVCSSPWNESPAQHDPSHAWAWDRSGYADMIEKAGWTILHHEQAGLFQVVLAE